MSAPQADMGILDLLRHSESGFRLRKRRSAEQAAGCREVSREEVILRFISAAESEWPFTGEPTPRALGSCVELLRACRFYGKLDDEGNLVAVYDRDLSRMIGAYDTPDPVVDYLVEAALPSAEPGEKNFVLPTVVDLACGAGYFLIKALDVLCRRFPQCAPLEFLGRSVIGVDIDPVSVALSMRNLRWHLVRNYSYPLSVEIPPSAVVQADSLGEIKDLPLPVGRIQAVVGNPPYLCMSGRGSPVARLKADGMVEEAEELSIEIERLKRRFQASSQGCVEKYKWFIERAVDCLAPGGRLCFITPDTWLSYPRYRDIRRLLKEQGQIECVLDLGKHPFRRVCVPTATLVWVKGEGNRQESFIMAMVSGADWDRVASRKSSLHDVAKERGKRYRIDAEGDIRKVGMGAGPRNTRLTGSCDKCFDDTESLVEFLLEAEPEPHRVRLGDAVLLREGSHAIRAVAIGVPRTASRFHSFPVIVDKSMAPMKAPEIGYIASPANNISRAVHTGERFLIRKTGDRIVAAPAPTTSFALAHQNVYVGKVLGEMIQFHAVLGILNSELLTRIYRSGPGGQEGRQLAQFRIQFLNSLPLVVVPPAWKKHAKPQVEEAESLTRELLDGRKVELEPVSVVFPQNEKGAVAVTEQILLYHDIIAKLAAKLLESQDFTIKPAIDEVVSRLYGGGGK